MENSPPPDFDSNSASTPDLSACKLHGILDFYDYSNSRFVYSLNSARKFRTKISSNPEISTELPMAAPNVIEAFLEKGCHQVPVEFRQPSDESATLGPNSQTSISESKTSGQKNPVTHKTANTRGFSTWAYFCSSNPLYHTHTLKETSIFLYHQRYNFLEGLVFLKFKVKFVHILSF